MSLINSQSDVQPRIRVAPSAARNDANLVVDLLSAYGTELDPWQVDMLEAGCGVGVDGSWAASTTCCSLSRQNGKSVVLIARALAGALLFGEKVVILSAHEQKTSRVLFQALESYFESYSALSRRVKSIGRALGREEIWLKDGAHLFFPARTRNTLRGWSIDCYLADEAQLITDAQWESVKPAMSARPNAVAWLFGTAPQMLGDGEVFGRLRTAAHDGSDEKLAWVEYGADPGCDLDDRSQWAKANPGRVEITAIEGERRELSDGGFSRERLNLWPLDRVEQVFDPQQWAGLVSAGPPAGTPPDAIGVDRSPDGGMAVAACWLTGDRPHVELVAADDIRDPYLALKFVTDVVAGRRRVPVVIDAVSQAAVMIPALQVAKVRVIVTGARDAGRAAAGFLDDVESGRLSHGGQRDLDLAVAGARRRPIGDGGLFGWDRHGAAFISPLVACTLARHGAITAGRRATGQATFA